VRILVSHAWYNGILPSPTLPQPKHKFAGIAEYENIIAIKRIMIIFFTFPSLGYLFVN